MPWDDAFSPIALHPDLSMAMLYLLAKNKVLGLLPTRGKMKRLLITRMVTFAGS